MLLPYLIIVVYFTLFFIVATIIKNNSIVDIGWGFGFVLTAWILFFISGEFTIIKIIANILVSLWGLRLFYHILKRNLFEEEDFRYKAWREAWGKWVIPRAFFQVFMLQGLFQFMIGSVVFYINIYNPEFNMISLIGVGLWVIGYYYEVIGDRELKIHIAKRDGKLLTTGLWKQTRHPNYFGEAIMWWGIFLFGVLNNVSLVYIISPLTIHLVLRMISIPLLEEKMSKREEWGSYALITPIMFPVIGKRG